MKYRYLAFSYPSYYPGGGMSDCLLRTNDLEEARAKIEQDRTRNDPYHGGSEIYDCETGEIVEETEAPHD